MCFRRRSPGSGDFGGDPPQTAEDISHRGERGGVSFTAQTNSQRVAKTFSAFVVKEGGKPLFKQKGTFPESAAFCILSRFLRSHLDDLIIEFAEGALLPVKAASLVFLFLCARGPGFPPLNGSNLGAKPLGS